PLSPSPQSLEHAMAASAMQIRIAHGLTLSELASRVGLCRQRLSQIENAQRWASVATMVTLARGVLVRVDRLVRAADHETQSVFSKSGQAPETVRRGSNLGHR